MNKKNHILKKAHILLILVFICIYIVSLIHQLTNGNIVFDTLKTLILFSVVLNIIFILSYRLNWASLVYLFNVTFIIFLFSRPFVDILGYKDALDFNSLVSVYLDEKLYKLVLTYITISYFTVNLGFVFLDDRVQFPHYNERMFELSKYLMIFSVPFILYKYYLDLSYLLANGYLSLFAGGLSEIDYGGFVVANSHSVFSSGFFLMIASNPKFSQSKIYVYVFLVISFLDALKGSRGLFVLPVFFCFWYIHAKSETIMSNKKKTRVVLIGIILIFASQIAVNLRMQNENNSINFIETISSFFYQQGNSINIVYFSELYKNILNSENKSVPFVLEPIIFPYLYLTNIDVLSKGQNEGTVEIRPNLNHRLTYLLNENYYRRGGGLGSSFIAELAIINIIFVIIASLFIPMASYVLYKGMKYRIIAFLSYFFVTHILILPRASFIPNFWVLGKYVVFFLILYFVSRISLKYDKNKQ